LRWARWLKKSVTRHTTNDDKTRHPVSHSDRVRRSAAERTADREASAPVRDDRAAEERAIELGPVVRVSVPRDTGAEQGSDKGPGRNVTRPVLAVAAAKPVAAWCDGNACDRRPTP